MPKQTYTPTPADKATGARVRQLRKLAGETLIQTTLKSGISFGYATLCRVELGERHLSIPDATKLAAHFNTTVDRVMVRQQPAETFTEQEWLRNTKPEPAPLFAVPETSPLHKLAGVGFGGADLNANVITIERDNPLTPEQYREQVWVPYLEARYSADQKAS